MKAQSVCSNIVNSFSDIPYYLKSAKNQTISMIGLAALKISAALWAIYEWCKVPFSKVERSTPHKFEYINKNSFEIRKELSSNISAQYPDKIAVIVERHFASKAPKINNPKFLAPQDITASKFQDELKKHFPSGQQDIAFFIDNAENKVLPLSDGDMKSIAEKYRNEDGFLYIYYTSPGERV